MKKNIICVIIITWALSSLQMVYAQQSNSAQLRRAIDAALNTIESYSVWSTLADAEAHYEFLNLFVDKNSLVYNDLLGIKRDDNLTIEDYANTMLYALRNKKIFLKNIKNEGVSYENEQIRIRISVDKAISYIDSCGTYFSSSEFYAADHHLLFTLIYDNQERSCKIESITGSINSPHKLLSPFFAVKSGDKRDSLLIYDGSHLSFNSYHQALLDGLPNSKQFKSLDPNVIVKPQIDECNHVTMKYRERRFRLKAHYDLGLGDVYKLDGADDALTIDKNLSNNIGLDFGYVFPSKGMLKTGLFVGVGFAQSKIDLGYTNTDYTYTTTMDVDGDSYTRHYQNLNINQSIKMTEMSIPLYANFNFHFNRVVNLFVDLGAKFNMNMGHKIDKTEGGAYIYGIYPQYDNLRMDEHWGYNGFGNQNFSSESLDNQDLLDVSSLTIDAFAGAGLRFNIPKSPIAIDLSVNYQMGLIDVVKANPTPVALSGTLDPANVLVYNTINNAASTEHLRNLTESLSKVKRQYLMFSAGIILKL